MSGRRRTGSVKGAALIDAHSVRIGKALGMRGAAPSGDDPAVVEVDPVRLVRAFRRIREQDVRCSIVALVETIAARCTD